jgi:hypothetical protein
MFDAMNANTKITLSAKELDLVCNIDWILTKHAIIQKVYELFGSEAFKMQQVIAKELPSLANIINEPGPKIAKGENYKNLPYVMLDYPRRFEKEKTLAIRTMFWWGNFFSIHLQLTGSYKHAVIPTLQKNFSMLRDSGYAIGIGEDPWEHHFEENNYLLLKNCSEERFTSIIKDGSFIKVGKILPLREWDGAERFIEKSFLELVELLKP